MPDIRRSGETAAIGRGNPKLTTEMREALAHAAVDLGYTAREVADLARDALLVGLPAFDVSPSTVQDLASRSRRERGTAQRSDPATERMRKVAEATIARVEQMESPGAKELSSLREASRVLEQLDRAEWRRAPARKRERRRQLSDEEYALRFVACLAERDKPTGIDPCKCGRPHPSWWPEGAWPDGDPICQVFHLPIKDCTEAPDELEVRRLAFPREQGLRQKHRNKHGADTPIARAAARPVQPLRSEPAHGEERDQEAGGPFGANAAPA